MTVCLVSLKFSPAHVSHMKAYAKLFKDIGNQVCFLLNEDYAKMANEEKFEGVFFELNEIPNVDLVLFFNTAIDNPKVAKYFKKRGAKIMLLYHEPYDSVVNYLKEGFKQTLKAIIAHHFSVETLKLSDAAIIPSEFGVKLYSKHDIKFCNSFFKIPLLFDDETQQRVGTKKKEYFSYIGHAVKGHAFEKFLDFIQYLYKQGLNMRFQITTRTNIDKLIRSNNLLLKMISNGALVINHGRVLSNDEINDAYESSFCIWNIYNRSTQSGVLPKAFMFGTPVIANNIGSFPEFVQNGYNGFIVEANAKKLDFEIIKEKLITILNMNTYFSLNARKSFEQVFYYRNYSDLMRNIISKLFNC